MKELLEKFGSNKQKEQEGSWIHYGEDLAFKCKRISGRNKQFLLAAERLEKLKRRGELPKAEEETKLAEMFVDTCLVDWKGVTDDKNQPIPFSKKAAVEFLTDDRWPDFFNDLFTKAQDNAYFKDLEAEAGN